MLSKRYKSTEVDRRTWRHVNAQSYTLLISLFEDKLHSTYSDGYRCYKNIALECILVFCFMAAIMESQTGMAVTWYIVCIYVNVHSDTLLLLSKYVYSQLKYTVLAMNFLFTY